MPTTTTNREADPAPTCPTIFISYSHKDKFWKDKLVSHLHSLAQAGVGLNVWHDGMIDGGKFWHPEIEQAIANTAAAILLISPDFLASRFCVHEEVPALLKRHEEQGMLLIPVLLRQCVWQEHRWLKNRQMLPRDGKCVAINFPGKRSDVVFTPVALQVLAHLKHLASQPEASVVIPSPVQELAAQQSLTLDPAIIPPPSTARWPALALGRIDIRQLPGTGKDLFGRDKELALLDQAWGSPTLPGATPIHILAFTAHGGVGKSTLVNHWLDEMARDNYRGARRVYGWSFYDQGVRDEAAASADSFMDAALRFFGDPEPTAGSPWDKGARLADLVGSQSCLLVLDGLEPLQSRHAFDRGKLRDQALESLLRSLARRSAGLCLISTREPLPDLAERSGVVTCDLEQITPQAGRALLRTAGVVGTDAELEALANRFGPHALAVSLLAVYLREQPGQGVAPALALEKLPGEKPIDRVLAGFEQWLGDSPECQALRLLGFFDRPADAGCLGALRKDPAISGLTDRLAGLDNKAWSSVLDRLKDLQLIHVRQKHSGEPDVDAHPLIREHFAEKLKISDAWRQGHRRLYEHLRVATPDKDKPTINDLEPLYQAVTHGCEAGEYEHAFKETYWIRIQRKREGYPHRKLGVFQSDLSALACFFEETWHRPRAELDPESQAIVLGTVGSRWRALGRIKEAIEPTRQALEVYKREDKWSEWAALEARHLSEIYFVLGCLLKDDRSAGEGAIKIAEEGVRLADASQSCYQRYVGLCVLGTALHHIGDLASATDKFQEATRILTEESGFPMTTLYSLWGFRYGDLLLDQGQIASARALANSIEHSPKDKTDDDENRLGLIGEAMEKLLLAKVEFAEHQDAASPAHLVRAGERIDDALSQLRKAARKDFLPLGLFAKARLFGAIGALTSAESSHWKKAATLLEEAEEISQDCEMLLYQADCHLEFARLYGAWGSISRQADLMNKAKKRLEEGLHLARSIGYGMFGRKR